MLRSAVALVAALLIATMLPAGSGSAAAAGAVEVTIAEVDLDGPHIATTTVTVTNNGSTRLTRLNVSFKGPVGWAVQPASQSWSKAVSPGASATLTFKIQVPAPRPGFRIRTFAATATYTGGDGAGTAVGTRTQYTGEALPNLAAAYNNVGVTDESATTAGDFDGEGNSFSAQKLAAVGVTPGGTVTALGVDFTWPDVAPGEEGNVAAGGQAVQLSGTGERLAFLGSGSSFGASGNVTVHYTDGTSSTGFFGFPNWSFQEPGTHGATLVASSDGRNRPDGYGNAGIAYRVFAHQVDIDPSKTVAFVVLPSSPSLHIFDMKLAD
ncbi:NEW3 domain-containing protein [Nocardioides speluncae]|uniref:NEW3 domain-containing protein n=1 Tax=Nocardioides speluncae TaxID=2670337 RepID=UPI000D689CCA|nr:NEW3 domain-containing protein [Nocardioides speluncae]